MKQHQTKGELGPAEETLELLTMGDADFKVTWEGIVGEPPAIMLERGEMVAILEEAAAAVASRRDRG